MTTVLTTGGCGFIGSAFVRLLRQERPQWRVVNLDKLTYAGNLDNLPCLVEDEGYRFTHADVADRDAVHRLFDEERPEYVVHLAAESHVDRSIDDSVPFIHTNVGGTQVLLEAARAFGLKRFLYVSTDEVYGDVGADGAARSEESPLRPSNPYAVSKAAADLLTQSYIRTYNIPALIVRPCNHYGPYQYAEKLLPLVVWNMLQGKRLPVYGDGRQRRDWLFVEDGARALLAVLEEGSLGAVYNVAAHQERENLELLRTLCQLMAERQRRSFESLWETVEHVADRPGHDVRYALDDRLIRDDTGWQPQVALGRGLRETVDWYCENQRWFQLSVGGR